MAGKSDGNKRDAERLQCEKLHHEMLATIAKMKEKASQPEHFESIHVVQQSANFLSIGDREKSLGMLAKCGDWVKECVVETSALVLAEFIAEKLRISPTSEVALEHTAEALERVSERLDSITQNLSESPTAEQVFEEASDALDDL